MIYEITSSNPKFKCFKFNPGLNIVVADRGGLSKEHQSRNGVGKSSLIEVIHFLMGTLPSSTFLFDRPELYTINLSMTFDLYNHKTTVIRRNSAKKSSKTVFEVTPPLPKIEHKNLQTKYQITITDHMSNAFPNKNQWITYWGEHFFEKIKDQPSGLTKLRTYEFLLNFFVRREVAGGFNHNPWISTNALAKSRICKITAISFFMGLDPEVIIEEKAKRDAYSKIYNDIFKRLQYTFPDQKYKNDVTIDQLMQDLKFFQDKLEQLKTNESNPIHNPHYQKLADQIKIIDDQIKQKSDQLAQNKYTIEQLRKNFQEDQDVVNVSELEEVYQEYGVLFKNFPRVSKNFDAVKDFNASLQQIHKDMLQQKIVQLISDNKELENVINKLEKQRRDLLNQKESSKLTDSIYAQAKEEVNLEKEIKNLKRLIREFEELEKNKAVSSSKHDLVKIIDDYISKHSVIMNMAQKILNDLGNELYQKPIKLSVFGTLYGVESLLEHDKSASKGVSNMLTFCFDLMLMRLASELNLPKRLDFLVHDSHIFDTVDERQVAKALDLSQRYTQSYNFQHIITLNSNVFESTKQMGYDFERFKNSQTFDDSHDSGLLFGQVF